MLEKVNGDDGPAAVHPGGKRKSRSPSPQPSFGPTEMLQRERLKRLRKDKAENGCVQVRLNGSKGSARKSINPGRLSVNKVDLLSAVVKRQEEEQKEAVVEDGGGGGITTDVDMATCGKRTNGTAVAAKRPKIDFVMEASDEENEEENEGLKKLVENIENDLGIPEGQGPRGSRKTSKEEEERRRKRPAVQRKKEGEAIAEIRVRTDGDEEGREKEKGGGRDSPEVVEEAKESEPCLGNETITLESSQEVEEDVVKKKDEAVVSKEVEKEKEVEERRPTVDDKGKEEEEEEGRPAVDDKGKEEEEEEGRPAVDDKGKEEEDAPVLGDSSEDEKGSDKEEKKRKEEDEKESVLEVILDEDNVPAAEDGGEATAHASGAAFPKEKEKEESDEKKSTGTIVEKKVEPDVKDASVATAEVKVKKEETKKRKIDQSGDIVVMDSEPRANRQEAVKEEEPRKPEEECKAEDLGGGGGGVGKDKIYRLTKSELEMLVINKVTEFFSDSNKSELGALRYRCEQLEKYLEQWRRKAQFYQKQMTDMQSVVQRARKFAVPQRPSMRSVGLQVQLTRYIPADPSKLVSRVAQMAVPASKPLQQHQPLTGQPQVVVPKQVSTNQLAFVTNLGPQGSLTGATFINKNGMPQMSNVGLTATVNTILASRPMTSTFSMPTRPAATVGQFHGGPMGVSLLHPRISNAPGTYIIGSSQNVTNTVATGTVVKAPGSGPLLRTTLDAAKAASSVAAGSPVPTCLVQNQALIGGTTTASSQTANLRPAALPLIGQPTVLAPGVKLIDLTADEEDAKAQQAAAAAAAALAVAAATSAAATPLAPGTMTMMPATLCTGNNTMTVLTPSSVSGVSTGQLLALSSAIVSNSGTLASATPLRVTAPIRGAAANAIVNSSGPVRLTYLMPASSMMTMVRPNQPMFVTPSTGIRPGPTGVPRQGLPTIVLQRGTTLVPLQQGQMTALPTVRPGAIISSPSRTISTATGPVTIVGAPTVCRTVTTSSAAAGVTSFNLTSGAANSMLNVPVAKIVTTPAHVPRHPAPLPIQPKYPDLPPSSGRKAVPPRPTLKISKVSNGIVLSWNMCLTSSHSDIASYQLYAYQEGASAPSTALWKKVGDVKALPLPMACTLTQFMEGHKYYFAVRAVDAFNRLGPFSDPGSIALMTAGATPAAAPVGKPTPVALKS